MEERIGAALGPLGVEHFGVVRFGDCLPLLDCRGKGRVPEGARSVIVCLFPWDIGDVFPRNVSRYAVADDYHRIAGGILDVLVSALEDACPGEAFVRFVDSSPIREVAAAAMAGLGVVGLHGQLIHRDYGSRVFIGEVVTTLELMPSEVVGGSCLECGACLGACPTGAIGRDRRLERSLCRSAITQKKGALTEWERDQIAAGGLVWGCDLCTDACPMNTGRLTPIGAFWENPAAVLTAENLDTLMADKSYGWRGRAVLTRNLNIIRNGS